MKNRRIKFLVFLCMTFLMFLYTGFVYASPMEGCIDGSHEFESELLVPNTEDEEGQVRNTCIKCGYSYMEYLPRTGHQYGDWIVVEQDSEAGIQVEERECINCHRTEHRETEIPLTEGIDETEETGNKRKGNAMDYILLSTITCVWSYAAVMLWYNSLVLNWYKKAYRNR